MRKDNLGGLIYELFIDPLIPNRLIRKIRLSNYKRKSLMIEKADEDKLYYVKFKVTISDENNPKEFPTELNMVVPARAAFFAKKKLLKSIKKKIDIDIVDIDRVSEDQLIGFDRD